MSNVSRHLRFGWLIALALIGGLGAQQASTVGPKFVDGQAQIVPEFAKPSEWIREHLWVETEFDSDHDGTSGH